MAPWFPLDRFPVHGVRCCDIHLSSQSVTGSYASYHEYGGSAAFYNYDPFGRLDTVTSGTQVLQTNTYDGFDNIVSHGQFNPSTQAMDTTSYTYDPLNRQASQTTTAGTTSYAYLGLSTALVSESDPGGQSKTYDYTPGGARLSQTTTDSGGTSTPGYYSYNDHADVEAVTGASGTAKATYAYTAYGDSVPGMFTGADKNTASPGSTTQPYSSYRFNAMRWDSSSGQYDMGFRNYDPGLNQFVSRDMYDGALADMGLDTDPFTGSRYAFGDGNPISNIELDGHTHCDVGICPTQQQTEQVTQRDQGGCLLDCNYDPTPGQLRYMRHLGYRGSKWASTAEIAHWLSQDVPVNLTDEGWDFFCQGLAGATPSQCRADPFTKNSNIYWEPSTGQTIAGIGLPLLLACALATEGACLGGLPALDIGRAGAAGGEGVLVEGAGSGTRVINFRPDAADPNWGLTSAHLEKHLFGSGPLSLSTIDPGGNPDLWFSYIQDLASRPATATLKGGIEDIIGTFPKTGGNGTFQFGIRIAPAGNGTFDLVTLLTKQ